MLVALCPKCNFPIWFGTLETVERTGTCQLCEVESDVDSCDKLDDLEWREKILSDDTEFTVVRNAFKMNLYQACEKMDLPQFLAEWRLLTKDDIDLGDSGEVGALFREEFKCLAERVLKRLNERREPVS